MKHRIGCSRLINGNISKVKKKSLQTDLNSYISRNVPKKTQEYLIDDYR